MLTSKNSLAHTQTIIILKTFHSKSLVQLHRIQNELYVLKRCLLGKFQNLLHRQFIVECSLLSSRRSSRTRGSRSTGPCSRSAGRTGTIHRLNVLRCKNLLTVAHNRNNGIVIVLYLSSSRMLHTCSIGSVSPSLYIKFHCGISKHHLYLLGINHLLGSINCSRRKVLQNLKAIATLSAGNSQSRSNVQSYHTGTGYSHSHSVF